MNASAINVPTAGRRALRAVARLAAICAIGVGAAAFAQDETPPDALPPVSANPSARIITTDLGAICVIPARGFRTEGSASLTGKKGSPPSLLEFANGSEGRAGAEFDLPESAPFAIAIHHEGAGPLTFEVGGLSLSLPALPPGAGPEKGSTLVTTAFLAGADNEIALRSSAQGKIRGIVASEPLARLRALALRRSQLLVKRRMLEGALQNRVALVRANAAAGAPAELAGALRASLFSP